MAKGKGTVELFMKKKNIKGLYCILSTMDCAGDLKSLFYQQKKKARPSSSIGIMFAWHANGPKFDAHVQHILSWRLGHENIFAAILPLPLIQEEQLSVTGERMCTKYW